MDVRHRRVLSLGVGAALVLSACAKEHGEKNDVKPRANEGADAGPSAAEGGTSGTATKPSVQPKSGKAGVLGTKAVAALETVEGAPEDDVRGKANFVVTEAGVDLSLLMRGCEPTDEAVLFLLEGSDCSEATLAGPRWDGRRGEGIPRVSCLGINGQGRLAFTRRNDEDAPWSIGTSEASDILLHALVYVDAPTGEPIACGVITLDESDPPSAIPADVKDVPLAGRAQIAGSCFGGLVARSNDQACPNPKELTECAAAHCQLDACVAKCGNYLACTTKEEDPCSVAFTCPIDNPCAECQSEIQACMFSFCPDVVTCAAPPTPDGACSKLVACCNLQGDRAEDCIETVRELEKFSGDPSCMGAMHDFDFFSHLPVPCTFE
jgi:hypothetical protein